MAKANDKYKKFYEHLQDLTLQFTRQANTTVYNNCVNSWQGLLHICFNDTGFHHDTLIKKCINMKANHSNTRISIFTDYFKERMDCSQCTVKLRCAMLSKSREYISITADIKYKKFYKILKENDITDYYGICLLCQNTNNYNCFGTIYSIKPKADF